MLQGEINACRQKGGRNSQANQLYPNTVHHQLLPIKSYKEGLLTSLLKRGHSEAEVVRYILTQQMFAEHWKRVVRLTNKLEECTNAQEGQEGPRSGPDTLEQMTEHGEAEEGCEKGTCDF